jgi:hypothetical protein
MIFWKNVEYKGEKYESKIFQNNDFSHVDTVTRGRIEQCGSTGKKGAG